MPDTAPALPSTAGGPGPYDPSRMRRIVLDVSDFIFWLKRFRALSGIQRFDAELIRFSLHAFAPGEIVYCMADDPDCLSYWQIPAEKIRELLVNLELADTIPLEKWTSSVSEAFGPTRFSQIVLGNTDVLFIPGAFWVQERIFYLINKMRMNGTRIVVCVYDLIPIIQPEFCSRALVKSFGVMFNKMSYLVDSILTISNFTQNQVFQFYRETGRTPVPTIAIPLAQSLPDKIAGGAPQTISPRLAALMRDPYVLCVGTIEARKNHVYLFRIWRDLLTKHGPRAIPRLVWVGRRGWQADGLMEQLEATGHLDGHVVVLHELSDFDLSRLYRNCLFTAFPSLSEGWGLPVGESLYYGKVCVASQTTSIPEVGQAHAVYCDPYNIGDGFVKIEALIFDHARRTQREALIRAAKLRNWDEVSRDFFAQLFLPLPADGMEETVPSHPLPYATRVRVADMTAGETGTDLMRRLAPPPLDMHLVDGWHQAAEAGRIWGKDNHAVVRFSLPSLPNAAEQDVFRIYLELSLPPWQIPNTVWIATNDGKSEAIRAGREDFPVVLSSKGKLVGSRMEFELIITLETFLAPPSPDTRSIGIGIRSLGVVRANDVANRAALIEKFIETKTMASSPKEAAEIVRYESS